MRSDMGATYVYLREAKCGLGLRPDTDLGNVIHCPALTSRLANSHYHTERHYAPRPIPTLSAARAAEGVSSRSGETTQMASGTSHLDLSNSGMED